MIRTRAILSLLALTLSSFYYEIESFSIQPHTAALLTSRNNNAIAKINIILHASSSSSLSSSSKNEHEQHQELRWKSILGVLRERSDTLRAAGFYENEESNEKDFIEPVTAGAKTNITLFLLALGYKWYRSVFINKMAIWERQPQWNTVITSKEDEEKAKLEALTCKNCGATIFIAKGRKWFQMPRGYECYVCGASGNENFENTRDDLLEEIEDDYFDYEKPLDFVSAAERRKLMKEAGGDEEKAIALLTQQNNDVVEGEEGVVVEEVPKKKKKKKKGTKKKKKKKADDVEAAAAATTAATTTATKEEVNGGDESPSAPAANGGSSNEKKSTDDDLDLLGMD